jgi:hypothetical protein
MALTADEAASMIGPDTIDCIAPADRWDAHWTGAAAAKRAGAAWLSPQGRPDPDARAVSSVEAG